MNKDESVKYEYEENDKRIIILFEEKPIIEDEASFRKTHYFTDAKCTKITTGFKNELLGIFNVSNLNDLKEIIEKNGVKLVFKPGNGKSTYDESQKKVIIYTGTFNEKVVKPAAKEKRLKKNIVNVANSQQMSSSAYTELIATIVDNANNVELSESDKALLAKKIPELIRNKKVKISLHDITDINKQSLRDIIQLGRDLLSKKRGVEKRLGISRDQVDQEYAWQKYFELYGTYLLFGSIEENIPESMLKLQSEIRASDSRLDLLTINRYGFLDIVELKKADEYLFKLDKSHDNIVPTANLSTAIAQVNNYLMLLPYSQEHGELIKGAESATGMLVFGSTPYLMRKGEIAKYAQKNNISEETVNVKIRKALRDLNYSYSHIQITLYDEILDNLEKFIDQMEIEVNI